MGRTFLLGSKFLQPLIASQIQIIGGLLIGPFNILIDNAKNLILGFLVCRSLNNITSIGFIASHQKQHDSNSYKNIKTTNINYNTFHVGNYSKRRNISTNLITSPKSVSVNRYTSFTELTRLVKSIARLLRTLRI